jgi:hypothetical protein
VRFTGKLEIGLPTYRAGLFSVEMVYVNHHALINDDDIKSCDRAVRQQFLQLLHMNGFTSHGFPDVKVKRVTSHMLRILVSTGATREKRPQPIVIESLKPDTNES